MAKGLIDYTNIESGNDFVPPGNNQLPEPIMTSIYVTIWYH